MIHFIPAYLHIIASSIADWGTAGTDYYYIFAKLLNSLPIK